MSADDVIFDHHRLNRLGFGEAVFCAQKSAEQIVSMITAARDHHDNLLLTRLDADKCAALPPAIRDRLDYDPPSATAFYGTPHTIKDRGRVAVVSAGTSDAPAAREALRTLTFHGVAATPVFDVGVAGIWRLMERVDDLAAHPVVIAVAGMDAALVSVLGGLIPGVLIAVPTSTGYGAARDGETALAACLTSCAPGVLVCNIDNGYGAACAALRILRGMTTS